MPYYNSASEVFRLATSQTELKVFTGRSFSTGKYSGSLKSCKFPCCRVLSFATNRTRDHKDFPRTGTVAKANCREFRISLRRLFAGFSGAREHLETGCATKGVLA